MRLTVVVVLLACGESPSAEPDGGPSVEPDGGPSVERDTGPSLDAGRPLLCSAGERFDVLREDRFGPVTGLDLARSESELALLVVSGTGADAEAFVAYLDVSGAWTGRAIDLGPGGPGSIAYGRFDRAPGYTIVHVRPDGLVTTTLDGSGALSGSSTEPSTPWPRRPAIAVSDRAMVVGWASGARGTSTRAVVSDLESAKSVEVSLEGGVPAAAIFAEVEPELVFVGATHSYRRWNASGVLQAEELFGTPYLIAGFDMASTSAESAILSWGPYSVPLGGTGMQIRRGPNVHEVRWEGDHGDGALAYDGATDSVLAAVSHRGIGAVVARGGDFTDEIELAAVAPQAAVATVTLGGSFLVVWNDVIEGRSGVSGRVVTCAF